MGKIVGKTRLFVSGIVVGSCGLMAASGNLFAANGGSIAFVTSKPKVELNAPKKRVLAPVKTYLTQANKNSQAKNQTGAAGQQNPQIPPNLTSDNVLALGVKRTLRMKQPANLKASQPPPPF